MTVQRLNSRPRVIYSAIGAFIGWFAVIAQLYLIIVNNEKPIANILLEFFSYFTILTNIIIATVLTVLVLKNQSPFKSFVSRSATLTATAVYIFVVGLIYNFVLRRLVDLHGLQRIVDELLHLFMPLLYLVYWFVFVPKKDLQWKDAVVWLVFPAIYFTWILIHGSITGFYPYPFVNVIKLGYGQVLYNSALVMMVFILLSLGFIGIGRLMGKRE